MGNSWWPFGKKKQDREETEQQFKDMLQEALLRQDDLEEAAEKLREAREEREKRKAARSKLNSQPT